MGGEGWPLPLLERLGRQIVIISIIITKYHCHLLRHYHFHYLRHRGPPPHHHYHKTNFLQQTKKIYLEMLKGDPSFSVLK